MIFQRTVNHSQFPRPKRKLKMSKTKPTDISLKPDMNQSTNFDLAKKMGRYQEHPIGYSERYGKPKKHKNAAHMSFRCVSISRQLDNIERVSREKQMERQFQHNMQISVRYPQFKASASMRNQLMYLNPQRRYLDKSLSLHKVKTYLYKQIVNKTAVQQIQIDKTKIIVYMTEYQDRDLRQSQDLEDKAILKNTAGKVINMTLLNLGGVFGKQNAVRNFKIPSIHILREKIKNRNKSSLYIQKLRNIRSEHEVKAGVQ